MILLIGVLLCGISYAWRFFEKQPPMEGGAGLFFNIILFQIGIILTLVGLASQLLKLGT